MRTLFFARCCVISCWTWLVMKWSGFKLATVSDYPPFFIFAAVSRFHLRRSLFLGIPCSPAAAVFFFSRFLFLFLVLPFSFLSLPLCLPHLRYFLGVFAFAPPTLWLVVWVCGVRGFCLGFLPVRLRCVGAGIFCGGASLTPPVGWDLSFSRLAYYLL